MWNICLNVNCIYAILQLRIGLTWLINVKQCFLKRKKKVRKRKNKTILPSTSIGGSGCLIMGSSGSWEVAFPFMFDNSSSCEDSKQNQKLRTRKQKKTQNKVHNREIKSKIKQDKISIGDLYMQSFIFFISWDKNFLWNVTLVFFYVQKTWWLMKFLFLPWHRH